MLEVSLLLSHLALPHQGHLQQLYHIFGCLKRHHNSELVFDPSAPVVEENDFELCNWWTTSEFGHLQQVEELPPNMPNPCGFRFKMCAKVGSDHTSDSTTQQSCTSFLVFLNSVLVYWMSKKQTSMESSSFGSEFVVMKQCH